MFAPDVALGIPVSMQEPGLGLGMGSSSAVPMSSMDQALMQMGHPAGPASALHAGMYEQPAGLPGSSATLDGAVHSQVSLCIPTCPASSYCLRMRKGPACHRVYAACCAWVCMTCCAALLSPEDGCRRLPRILESQDSLMRMLL